MLLLLCVPLGLLMAQSVSGGAETGFIDSFRDAFTLANLLQAFFPTLIGGLLLTTAWAALLVPCVALLSDADWQAIMDRMVNETYHRDWIAYNQNSHRPEEDCLLPQDRPARESRGTGSRGRQARPACSAAGVSRWLERFAGLSALLLERAYLAPGTRSACNCAWLERGRAPGRAAAPRRAARPGDPILALPVLGPPTASNQRDRLVPRGGANDDRSRCHPRNLWLAAAGCRSHSRGDLRTSPKPNAKSSHRTPATGLGSGAISRAGCGLLCVSQRTRPVIYDILWIPRLLHLAARPPALAALAWCWRHAHDDCPCRHIPRLPGRALAKRRGGSI